MNYLFSFQKVINHPYNRNAKIHTLGRLFLWKLNQLFLHKTITVNLTPEMKCVCHPDSSFGSLIIYTKLPEYEEMNFIYNYLEKDDVFIDVGANIGAHTLMAASKIKTGKIFSFEPSEKAILYLKENIQINNLNQLVTVVDKVVSNKNGFEKFIIGKHSEIDRIGNHTDLSYKMKTSPSISLDKFLSSRKVPCVDLIKIDVEGAELKVLEGLKNYLDAGKIEVIIFEINPNSEKYGYTSKEVINFLQQKSYLLYSLGENNKLSILTVDDLYSEHTFNALAVYKSKKITQRVAKYLEKNF